MKVEALITADNVRGEKGNLDEPAFLLQGQFFRLVIPEGFCPQDTPEFRQGDIGQSRNGLGGNLPFGATDEVPECDRGCGLKQQEKPQSQG